MNVDHDGAILPPDIGRFEQSSKNILIAWKVKEYKGQTILDIRKVQRVGERWRFTGQGISMQFNIAQTVLKGALEDIEKQLGQPAKTKPVSFGRELRGEILNALLVLDIGEGVPRKEIISFVPQYAPEIVDDGIQKMMNEGELYEPVPGIIRRV